MRGHAYRLQNPSLRSTFRRWQLQHQYQLKYITDAGKVRLKVIENDFAFRTKIVYILWITFGMYILKYLDLLTTEYNFCGILLDLAGS
jgi:hypothetical protein